MASSSRQRAIVALDEAGSIYKIIMPDNVDMTLSYKEDPRSYMERMQKLTCQQGIVLWVEQGIYEIWVTRRGRPYQIIARSNDPYAP